MGMAGTRSWAGNEKSGRTLRGEGGKPSLSLLSRPKREPSREGCLGKWGRDREQLRVKSGSQRRKGSMHTARTICQPELLLLTYSEDCRTSAVGGGRGGGEVVAG